MIKVNIIKSIRYDKDDLHTRIVTVELLADNPSEVEAIGDKAINVVGLKDNDILDFGSDCKTADLYYGMLNSEGVWTFKPL